MPGFRYPTSLFLLATLASACAHAPVSQEPGHPPIANKIHHEDRFHGDLRIDYYRWMHDRTNSDVKAHLESENTYTEFVTSQNAELEKQLRAEYRGLRRPAAKFLVQITAKHLYFKEKRADEKYYIWYRKNKLTSEIRKIFDENPLAKNYPHFRFIHFVLNPDETQAVANINVTGGEVRQPFLIDLETTQARELPTRFIWYHFEWLDGQTLLFRGKEKNNDNPTFCYEYSLGSNKEQRFSVTSERTEPCRSITRSADDTLLLSTGPELSYSDYDSAPPKAMYELNPKTKTLSKLPLVGANRNSHGWFKEITWYRTSEELQQFINGKWTTIYKTSEGNLKGLHLGKNFLVMERNRQGLEDLLVYDLKKRRVSEVKFSENTVSYDGLLIASSEEKLYFLASGYSFPDQTYSCKLSNCRPKIEVAASYPGMDPSKYRSKRFDVIARDGTAVPVTLVYRKDKYVGKNHPVKLYGYGAVGSVQSPYFNRREIPLLDRGVIYAIAHVRGGGEKGKAWHDDGRLFKKANSFNDFIDVAEHLIKSGLTSPRKLAIEGRSNGGALIGAVLNMRPELFRAAVMESPFLDVLNTMTLYNDPLAKNERTEWGDGLVQKEYEMIKTWDPYTNLRQAPYPSVFISSGFQDYATPYFQPMKWVARMREINPSPRANPVVLHTSFTAGHAGDTDLDQYERDWARAQAFLLGELGHFK